MFRYAEYRPMTEHYKQNHEVNLFMKNLKQNLIFT